MAFFSLKYEPIWESRAEALSPYSFIAGGQRIRRIESSATVSKYSSKKFRKDSAKAFVSRGGDQLGNMENEGLVKKEEH